MPECIASVAVYEPVLFRLLLDYQPRDRATTEVLIAAQSIRNWFALGHSARAAQRFVDFWSDDGAWARLPPVLQQLDCLAHRVRHRALQRALQRLADAGRVIKTRDANPLHDGRTDTPGPAPDR